MTKNGVNIFPILTVNFIGTLGYSIVLPFLVILVLKFGGNELIYGILGATYSFFQLIGAPILGSWSDRVGRRKILLLSQVGTFIAWIIFVIALLSPNRDMLSLENSVLGPVLLTIPLFLLFVARALDGITGGNVSVANAYLADISTEDDRTRNFGKMAAAGNMGFIIGPAAAGVLGGTQWGDLLPVVAAMVVSFVAIYLIAFQLKESRPCILTEPADQSKIRKIYGQEQKECHSMEGEDKVGFFDILKLPNISFLLTLYFLIFLAFNFFYVAFPVYAASELKWTVFQLGIFFSVLGGVMVLFQGPVLKRLSGRYSEAALIVAGSILLAVSFILLRADSYLWIFFGVVLFSSGNGIMWPSFLSVLSRSADDKYQGAVQGYASSAGSLASIAGLISGGILYKYLGGNALLISSGLMVIIVVGSLKLLKIKVSPSRS